MTVKLQEGLQRASTLASQRHNQGIDVEHLLAALLEQEHGIAPSLVETAGVSARALRDSVDRELGRVGCRRVLYLASPQRLDFVQHVDTLLYVADPENVVLSMPTRYESDRIAEFQNVRALLEQGYAVTRLPRPTASISYTNVLTTDSEGHIELAISGSANLPAGFDLVMQYAIADVAAHEEMARVSLQAGKVLRIAGVGQLVEIDDRSGFAGNPLQHKVGPDETGPAGNEYQAWTPVMIPRIEGKYLNWNRCSCPLFYAQSAFQCRLTARHDPGARPMKKILLVKTSSLGDVVHNLPVASDIRAALPGAEIDWVVEESFAAIPRLHSAVARVLPVAIRRWRSGLLSGATRAEIGAFLRDLKSRSYDAVIDTQGLLKSAWIAWVAHGMRHGLRYLELEVNNRLLRSAAGIEALATAVVRAVGPLLER